MDSDNLSHLIAPCGMNCALCMAYLRDRNKCPGCRGPDDNKAKTTLKCKMKTCEFFKDEENGFCFECDDFPCDKVEHIDKRYRGKYHMSMIENLKSIRDSGIDNFIRDQTEEWTCPKCGGTICVHKGYCYSCGMIYYGINR